MLISYSHQFIFIHIYKVAGTSIAETLGQYSINSMDRHASVIRFLRKLGIHRLAPRRKLQNTRAQRHATARAIRDDLPPDIFNNFYKFAFVRNPWDWQVSLYQFALEDVSHAQHEFIKSLGSFEKYLEWRVNGNYRLQRDFVVDESGALIVDFVGHYEQLASDFSKICQHIGIDNPQLSHQRSSSHNNYRTYYTEETAALVADAFNEDIEYFGYQYDQPCDLKSTSVIM